MDQAYEPSPALGVLCTMDVPLAPSRQAHASLECLYIASLPTLGWACQLCDMLPEYVLLLKHADQKVEHLMSLM